MDATGVALIESPVPSDYTDTGRCDAGRQWSVS